MIDSRWEQEGHSDTQSALDNQQRRRTRPWGTLALNELLQLDPIRGHNDTAHAYHQRQGTERTETEHRQDIPRTTDGILRQNEILTLSNDPEHTHFVNTILSHAVSHTHKQTHIALNTQCVTCLESLCGFNVPVPGRIWV